MAERIFHILFAEDMESFRTAAVFALEEDGYRVSSFSNGKEAVEFFQKDPKDIDLVLMDMIMPEMSGRRAWQEMRKLRSKFPMLLISGFSIENETREIASWGAEILLKPFEVDDLLKKVRQILRGPNT